MREREEPSGRPVSFQVKTAGMTEEFETTKKCVHSYVKKESQQQGLFRRHR